jgi:hypothetical protein
MPMTTQRSLALVAFAFAAAAISLSLVASAHGEEKAPPAGATTATVKAATAVENRLPVGEATRFAAGTRIFVWSEIVGADGETIEHVWKKDGTEMRRARFAVHSNRWRTNSRVPSAAVGHYVVEVLAGGRVIGSTSFVVE